MYKILKKLINYLVLFFTIIVFTFYGLKIHDLRLPFLITRTIKSTVLVKTIVNDSFVKGGSGAIISKNGWIVTAKHIVKDANSIEIELWDGKIYTATEWILDKEDDIALVKINIKTKPLKFKDEVLLGESIFIIGSPFGLFNTINRGIVSGLNRLSPFDDMSRIQLDIASNPGNSGCPVFNMYGKIVGIVVSSYRYSDGTIFIVPAKSVINFIEECEIDKEF